MLIVFATPQCMFYKTSSTRTPSENYSEYLHKQHKMIILKAQETISKETYSKYTNPARGILQQAKVGGPSLSATVLLVAEVETSHTNL